MSEQFFERPILNSPYEYPSQHWELNDSGQPTQNISNHRRPSPLVPLYLQFNRAIKKIRKWRPDEIYSRFGWRGGGTRIRNISGHINDIRELVDQWRRLPNDRDWQVTVETAHLLKYWRSYRLRRSPILPSWSGRDGNLVKWSRA